MTDDSSPVMTKPAALILDDRNLDLHLTECREKPAGMIDPQLALYHNTRHAVLNHSFIDKTGKQLRSPWLSRFDWVLDVGLEAGFSKQSEVVLSKQRENPRSVFVKHNLLRVFVLKVQPQLQLKAQD